ncbi:MAG: hypothetical protein Q7J07_01015 [Pelolinea sp.]|nr:hypothetical protein [Pelolinea sp.]
MFKNKKFWKSIIVAMIMVLVLTMPVFAQGETDPVEVSQPVDEPVKFLDHPIVQLLASFFKGLFNPLVEEVLVEIDPFLPDTSNENSEEGAISPEEPVAGETEPEDTPETTTSPEEAISVMHESDNLGYGEIVKLLGILEYTRLSCGETGELIVVPSAAAANAQAEFNASVANSDINQYTPTLAGLSITDGTVVHCQGTAVMTWMLPGVPPITLNATSVAETRARR